MRASKRHSYSESTGLPKKQNDSVKIGRVESNALDLL